MMPAVLPDEFTVQVWDAPSPGMVDAATGAGWRWMLPTLGPTTTLLHQMLLTADGRTVKVEALAWELGIAGHQLQVSARRLVAFSGLLFGAAGGVRPVRWMRPMRPTKLASCCSPDWRADYASAVSGRVFQSTVVE